MDNEAKKELFSFTKELTPSDVSRQQNRLRLIRETVEKELLPKMTAGEKAQLTDEGLKVKVTDDESGKDYEMLLKSWNNGSCFVLCGGGWWQYVADSNAQAKDVIELSALRDLDTDK